MPFASPAESSRPQEAPRESAWAQALDKLVKMLTGYAPMRLVPFHLLKKHGETAENTLRRWRTVLGLEEIQYLPEDIDDPDKNVSLGRTAHEIWHVLFSRPELIFGEPELIQSMAFQALWWAIEDPRVNLLGLKRHPGTRDWLDAAYAKDYEIKDLARARAAWAEIPLHLQFNYALIYEWWAGRPDPRATDPRVLEALAKTADAIRRAYAASDAERSFEIIRDEIWPVYKELVDEAYEEAMKRQGQQGQDQDQGADGESEGSPRQSQQGSGQGGSRKRRQVSRGVKEKMEKEEREFRDKHASKMVDKPEQMTEEQRARMKREIAELRRKMGQASGQEAKEQGEGRGQGRKSEPSPEELKSQRERLSRPDERSKELKPEDRSNYKTYYDRVKSFIPVMRQQFLQVLRRKIRRRVIRNRDSGDLDTDRLSQIPLGKRDLFKESMIANKMLYRVSLLIDTSASMGGEKKERAIEGAVLMMESLEKVPGVAYEIVVFDSRPRVVKSYNESVTPEIKAAIVSSIRNGSGSTQSHVALEAAIERIRMGRGERLVIMVNDGDPDDNFDREQYRALIKAAKDVDIHGVGLGPEAQLVLDLFPPGRGWWLKDAAEFAKNLRNILKKKLLGGA